MNIYENYVDTIKKGKLRENFISHFLTESLKLDEATEIADLFIDAIEQVTGKTRKDLPDDIEVQINKKEKKVVDKIDINDVTTFKVDGKSLKMGKVLSSFMPELTPLQAEKILAIVKGSLKGDSEEESPITFEETTDFVKYYNICYSFNSKSCMSKEGRRHLVKWYNNVDGLVMLLCYDKARNNDPIGRALLWKNVIDMETGKKVTYLDRTYKESDYTVNKYFHDYAKKKGWLYRKVQELNSRNSKDIISNGHPLKVEHTFENGEVLPYLDTFAFIYPYERYMSNKSGSGSISATNTIGTAIKIRKIVKKYELTDDTKIINGFTVSRIKALIDVNDDVPAGTMGGYVESSRNLSNLDSCWIYDDAVVMGNAKVSDGAIIRGNAVVKDDSGIYDNCIVGGKAIIQGSAVLFDDVKVGGTANIGGISKFYGDIKVMKGEYLDGIYEDEEDLK
jgi:hypothetical protein